MCLKLLQEPPCAERLIYFNELMAYVGVYSREYKLSCSDGTFLFTPVFHKQMTRWMWQLFQYKFIFGDCLIHPYPSKELLKKLQVWLVIRSCINDKRHNYLAVSHEFIVYNLVQNDLLKQRLFVMLSFYWVSQSECQYQTYLLCSSSSNLCNECDVNRSSSMVEIESER